MSAAAERAIRTIAVAGAGLTGLSAAVAFARALPRTKVTIVALPPDPSALADRMPASLPARPAPFHQIWARARRTGQALPFHL